MSRIFTEQVRTITTNISIFVSAATSVFALLALGQFKETDTPVPQSKKGHKTGWTTDARSDHLENKTTQNLKMSSAVRSAREGALWGMFIADALAMPVHWYYNPNDIKSGYGRWLTGYTAPARHHPSSILTLSATDSSGRTGWGERSKPVIGNVILHDKLKYWTSRDSSIHYHQGMNAGDSTLNSIMALQILKTMMRVDPQGSMEERELRGHVLQDYVKFMTTPNTHNDTYAESFHRSFFKDWMSEENPPKSVSELLIWCEERYTRKSRGSSDHQLVVIGAFVPAIPWIIRNAHKTESECAKSAVDFIKLTHPEPGLVPYIDLYARLLHSVINGADLTQAAMKCIESSELGGSRRKKMILSLIDNADEYQKGSDGELRACQSAVARLGSACYVEGAMSSMIFLAMKFAEDFNSGVLMNANCGGENCHRGAALGALLGAAAIHQKYAIPAPLKEGLGSAREGLTNVLKEMQNSNL